MKYIYYILGSFAVIIITAIAFRSFLGYWPVPIIFKKTYYVYNENSSPLKQYVINDFDINNKGFMASLVVNSDYELEHVIDVLFKKQNDTISYKYNFSGEIFLEIQKNNKIIHSEIIDKSEKTFVDLTTTGSPAGVFGFRLTTLPFPVDGETYNDLTIKVKVIKVDEFLKRNIGKVDLIISPNTEM